MTLNVKLDVPLYSVTRAVHKVLKVLVPYGKHTLVWMRDGGVVVGGEF